MSLLPLTFQLSSGTNQEFEDDNSGSRLGGGTAEGGGAPRGPWGAPGRPLRRGLLTGAVAPTPPVGQPWGPAPSRLGLPDEPRSRSLPHPSVNPLHFLSQTFYELPGPKAPACQFTRRTPHLRVSQTRNSSFCEADPALETFPRCSALTREALPHAFLRPSAARPPRVSASRPANRRLSDTARHSRRT